MRKPLGSGYQWRRSPRQLASIEERLRDSQHQRHLMELKMVQSTRDYSMALADTAQDGMERKHAEEKRALSERAKVHDLWDFLTGAARNCRNAAATATYGARAGGMESP